MLKSSYIVNVSTIGANPEEVKLLMKLTFHTQHEKVNQGKKYKILPRGVAVLVRRTWHGSPLQGTLQN